MFYLDAVCLVFFVHVWVVEGVVVMSCDTYICVRVACIPGIYGDKCVHVNQKTARFEGHNKHAANIRLLVCERSSYFGILWLCGALALTGGDSKRPRLSVC